MLLTLLNQMCQPVPNIAIEIVFYHLYFCQGGKTSSLTQLCCRMFAVLQLQTSIKLI